MRGKAGNAMSYKEALIERDLQELLGGDKPPDLIARTLAAAQAEPEPDSADARRQWLTVRRVAEAAVIVLAVGLIAWIIVKPRPLPEGIAVSADARYRVHKDHIELQSGWLLLTHGAPEIRAGSGSITEVKGRAIAGTGIPEAGDSRALASRFQLSAEEQAMLTDTRRWISAGAIALCLFTGSACVNGEQVQVDEPEREEPQRPPANLTVLREWVGADSKEKRSRTELVGDASAWRQLWHDHTGRTNGDELLPEAPEIDFETEVVLAVFGGSGWNSRGYRVVEILHGNVYTIRVVKLSFQTAGRRVEATPFGIFVLPRVNRPIRLEHNVQNIIGEPPLWQEDKSLATGLFGGGRPLAEYRPRREVRGAWPWEGTDRRPQSVESPRSLMLKVATDAEEFGALRGLVPDIDELAPDFSSQIVLVTADRVAIGGGVPGDVSARFEFEFVGHSETRTVIRVTPPVAHGGLSQPEYQFVYTAWLLPKPAAALAIETPVVTSQPDQPQRWREALSRPMD
jgi:hypothetical protein